MEYLHLSKPRLQQLYKRFEKYERFWETVEYLSFAGIGVGGMCLITDEQYATAGGIVALSGSVSLAVSTYLDERIKGHRAEIELCLKHQDDNPIPLEKIIEKHRYPESPPRDFV